MYELQTGHILTAPVVEYAPWPVLMASLDGLTDCGTKVVEFKYPSKVKHELAKQGMIPEMYKIQMQVQMMCADVKLADYVSYDGAEIVIIPYERDDRLCEEILVECKKFWECVAGSVEPSEYIVKDDVEDLKTLLDEYNDLKVQLAMIEAKVSDVYTKIKSAMQDKTEEYIGPYLLKWSERKGQVDYSSIPALSGIDLEQYRKASIKVLSIKGSVNN
jgi:predicted phage-related endonuclease